MLMRPIEFGRLTELSLAIGVGTKDLREEGDVDGDDDDEGPMVMVILSGRENDREPVPMVDEAIWNERSEQESASDEGSLSVFLVDFG